MRGKKNHEQRRQGYLLPRGTILRRRRHFAGAPDTRRRTEKGDENALTARYDQSPTEAQAGPPGHPSTAQQEHREPSRPTRQTRTLAATYPPTPREAGTTEANYQPLQQRSPRNWSRGKADRTPNRTYRRPQPPQTGRHPTQTPRSDIAAPSLPARSRETCIKQRTRREQQARTPQISTDGEPRAYQHKGHNTYTPKVGKSTPPSNRTDAAHTTTRRHPGPQQAGAAPRQKQQPQGTSTPAKRAHSGPKTRHTEQPRGPPTKALGEHSYRKGAHLDAATPRPSCSGPIYEHLAHWRAKEHPEAAAA